MFSRSDWLEAGLASLAQDGPNGLRIDRLCRRLEVSKGSFHHHFAGAADFKQALLGTYETRVVAALDEAIEQMTGTTPKAALAGLTAAITGSESFYRPDLEVAMRAWAYSDPEVRAVRQTREEPGCRHQFECRQDDRQAVEDRQRIRDAQGDGC